MSNYEVKVLRGEDYRTTNWSGGTTTEIAIAPEGSVYADRDFMWRLSSATVDVERSDFTALPDYNRVILTLKGKVRLSHDRMEWLDLPEFVPYAFDGGDETVSEGKVIDFNLMTRKNKCAGNVVPILLPKDGKRSLTESMSGSAAMFETVLLYCYEGRLTVTLENGDMRQLKSGDSIEFSGSFEDASWTLKAQSETKAVAAFIRSL